MLRMKVWMLIVDYLHTIKYGVLLLLSCQVGYLVEDYVEGWCPCDWKRKTDCHQRPHYYTKWGRLTVVNCGHYRDHHLRHHSKLRHNVHSAVEFSHSTNIWKALWRNWTWLGWPLVGGCWIPVLGGPVPYCWQWCYCQVRRRRKMRWREGEES